MVVSSKIAWRNDLVGSVWPGARAGLEFAVTHPKITDGIADRLVHADGYFKPSVADHGFDESGTWVRRKWWCTRTVLSIECVRVKAQRADPEQTITLIFKRDGKAVTLSQVLKHTSYVHV